MVYITGDTHGDFDRFIAFGVRMKPTKNDTMIVLGDDTLYRKENESVYIPIKTKHRIKNTSTDKPLVFIEIQTGENLDEDDIIRFEDNYGRIK